MSYFKNQSNQMSRPRCLACRQLGNIHVQVLVKIPKQSTLYIHAWIDCMKFSPKSAVKFANIKMSHPKSQNQRRWIKSHRVGTPALDSIVIKFKWDTMPHKFTLLMLAMEPENWISHGTKLRKRDFQSGQLSHTTTSLRYNPACLRNDKTQQQCHPRH